MAKLFQDKHGKDLYIGDMVYYLGHIYEVFTIDNDGYVSLICPRNSAPDTGAYSTELTYNN